MAASYAAIASLHARLFLHRPDIEEQRDRLSGAASSLDSYFEIVYSRSTPPATARQARDLIGLLGQYAAPKQMIAELGERIMAFEEVIMEEVSSQPPRARPFSMAPPIGPSPTIDIADRICLILQTYTAVVCRLPAGNVAGKTMGKVIDDIENILDTLMERKFHDNVELRPDEMRRVILAMCAFAARTATWAGRKTGASDLKDEVARVLSRTLLTGFDHLELNLLGVWFTQRCPERIPPGKQAEKASFGLDQRDVMGQVIATYESLGYDMARMLYIIADANMDGDPTPAFASLVVIACRLILENPVLSPDPLAALRSTLPRLRSMMDTPFSEAGVMWMAELVKRVVEGQRRGTIAGLLDEETAAAFNQMVMENIMHSPIEIAQQAQRRLIADIVTAARVPAVQVRLWGRMLSMDNPLEMMRASSLGLLGGEISVTLKLPVYSGILCSDLETLLKTQVFVIPDVQPSLRTGGIEAVAHKAWPIWFHEALDLLGTLLSAPTDPLNVKSWMERARLRDTFYKPLTQSYRRWEGQLGSITDPRIRRFTTQNLLLLGTSVAKIASVLN